ncbi:hypothetical protein I317_05522 [Kwoniella heveanensis CBS 569]|nr:hypothetical protein I317_05522 [Kwoniella heveanensis CBS 569]
MGALVWHHWGRLLAITSAVSSFWAFLYRKFFWDMVGGTLGPAGLIPGKNTQPLVKIVVDIPFLQIFTLILSLFALALEMPMPQLADTALHGSIVFRIVLYIIAGFVGIMVYQTVDCAVYFVITAIVYGIAMKKGENIRSGGQLKLGEA